MTSERPRRRARIDGIARRHENGLQKRPSLQWIVNTDLTRADRLNICIGQRGSCTRSAKLRIG